jgi:hypothetical protein
VPLQKVFNLTRWFSIVAALSIAATSVVTAYALSHFLIGANLRSKRLNLL